MSDDQFSGSVEYQVKVLSYMLHDHAFCDIASEALQHEYFADKALQWFYETLGKTPIKLTKFTLKEEIVKASKKKLIKPEEIDKYVKYYELLKQKPTPDERAHINDNLARFIKTQAVKRALADSWEKAKNAEWDEIVEAMTSAVQAGDLQLDSGYWYFESIQDRLASRLNSPLLEKIPTGIDELDSSCLFGGIKAKQLAMCVGGTGRGKSIFLEYIARTAILLGKKVVYYTLELSDSDVADRFDSLFSQTKINELKILNSDVFNALSPMSQKFGGSLVIKEYGADTATVNDIRVHIRQLSGQGFAPDLVIVDYLDLMKPHRRYNSTHEELDAITKALHGLSKDLECVVWTATQLNRAGLAMETPDETAIAGAVSKLYTVDVALFLAATREEREDEIARIIVSKNRNGPPGRSITIDTDFAKMTFYKRPVVTQSVTTTPSGGTEVTEDVQETFGDDDLIILE